MNDQTILKRRSGLMTANMNGSAVMMDIATGKYYNLGETGGRIWELLETPTSLSGLVQSLTAEYAISPEQCKEEVLVFLKQLSDRNLIITE